MRMATKRIAAAAEAIMTAWNKQIKTLHIYNYDALALKKSFADDTQFSLL